MFDHEWNQRVEQIRNGGCTPFVGVGGPNAHAQPARRGRLLAVHPIAGTGPDTRPEEYLRTADTALADGILSTARECALRAVHAGGHDLRSLAEAESLLGELTAAQARTQAGARAEDLYATAEEHYLRAAESSESGQDVHAVGRALASLGRLHLDRGRLADAVGALQGALIRLPGDFDIHLDLARALRESGQPYAALGEYGAVLTAAPETVEALVGRGAVNAEHADPASALDDLDNAVRLQPELAERRDVVSARAQAFARLRSRSPFGEVRPASP